MASRPQRDRRPPQRLFESAPAASVKEACRKVEYDAREQWLTAQRILEEREVDGKKEYLVKFLGQAEPEWACEVTPALIYHWEQRQPARQAKKLERYVEDDDYERFPIGFQASREFAIRSLAGEVRRVLKRIKKHSVHDPVSRKPRHKVRVPMLLPLRKAKNRGKPLSRAFSRGGLCMRTSFAAFDARPGWSRLNTDLDASHVRVAPTKPVHICLKVTDYTDYSHAGCPRCSRKWTWDEAMTVMPPCRVHQRRVVMNCATVTVSFAIERSFETFSRAD